MTGNRLGSSHSLGMVQPGPVRFKLMPVPVQVSLSRRLSRLSHIQHDSECMMALSVPSVTHLPAAAVTRRRARGCTSGTLQRRGATIRSRLADLQRELVAIAEDPVVRWLSLSLSLPPSLLPPTSLPPFLLPTMARSRRLGFLAVTCHGQAGTRSVSV